MLVIHFILAQLAAAGAIGAAPVPSPAVSSIERDSLRQLLTIRRVYVDRLNGGETAEQIRDMLIGSLQSSRLFVVTENQEHADAVVRGSAEDLVFTEQHSSSDGINAHANLGTSRSYGTYGGRYGGAHNSDSNSAGLGIGENESMRSVERRHEAMATIRLVNKDGDVIWSATEESLGGKFRGASADVADKITSHLADDYERARKLK
jgi:hypothetical protein